MTTNTPTAPTPDDLRAVMGRFATGVTVMTSLDGDEPHGMTANAVSSVSLDPLLVLVCVERTTEMARVVQASGHFALSILTAEQVALSNHFADPARAMGASGFADVATTTAATGAPVLADALAWLDCRVWALHDGGDHHIVVGEVAATGIGADADALGYFRSRYTAIAAP